MPSRASIAGATALVGAAAIAATLAPLWTYAFTLALFGVPHVLTELRYVDARFGARVGLGLARVLWSGLAVVVLLRLGAAVGVGAASARAAFELAAGGALAAAVVPRLARRSAGRGALAAAALALALGVATRWPLEAIVWFAVLHNVTPVGFVAEALDGRDRREALAACAIVFGIVPLAIASGALGESLAALGLAAAPSHLPGVGALEAHLGAFVPPAWRGEGAPDLFRAAAFLQCMHYAAVLHVLPRLAGAPPAGAPARAPFMWPRGLPSVALHALAALAAVGFALAFSDTRLVYAVLAAVHAWVEVPVLLLALGAARTTR